MKKINTRNIFTSGPISPLLIADSIANHTTQTTIGGHSIFLGQVRRDEVDGKYVSAIDYTAYEDLALNKMQEIRDSVFKKFSLSCVHVHHSLGLVKAGEICLFVFTSSAHRKPAIDACTEIVERMKAELPIWGKEIFDDQTHQWKENR
jgi:molybdopterin synthase catalytic subunit